MSRKILLTGATGFVGSAVRARLAELPDTNLIAAVRDLSLWQSSCAAVDYDLLSSCLPDLRGVDAVIHCAARVHVMADNGPGAHHDYRVANADATVRLARHAVACGVRRFVFLSTIKVNGETTQGRGPFTVNDTPAPLDPYSQAKHEAEQALNVLAATSALEIVIIRPPLVYGPGVKANFRALMKLLDSGWPLPFGALGNRRSVIAVQNLADLTVHCLDAPSAKGVVLARDSEQPTSSELMAAICNALGRRPRLVSVPASWLRLGGAALGKGKVMSRLCDALEVSLDDTISRLGWQPPLSMHDALKQTAQAYRAEKS